MLCSKICRPNVGIDVDVGDVALTSGFRLVDSDAIVCAMLCVDDVLRCGMCCVC